MLAKITLYESDYQVDFNHPIDISMPLRNGLENANCFYAPAVQFEPVRAGDFVGSTLEGGVVNFKNVQFNPHGNGTHTECVGHIASEPFTINQTLTQFMFPAWLTTIYPQKTENGDRIITLEQVKESLPKQVPDALIIRTMPNDDFKLKTNYSGANPPYIHHEAIQYLVASGVRHLLVDLPSVDREQDDGKLLAHRAFWQYPDQPRTEATITELVYIRNEIADGLYLLNIQIASFELDASPSKPVLYELKGV